LLDNDSEDSVDDTVVVMATPDELHSQQTVTADTNVDSNVTMETEKDKPDLTTNDDNSDDSEPVYDHDDHDDDDDHDHDDDDDDDNDNDELSYVDSSIHDKPVHKSGHIHLFSILQLLNGDLNVVQTYRVLACQILLCPSNSKARAAIHNGEFLDLSLTGKITLEPIDSI
jgi:ABC-type Zn2+ transport system substrate-binding protein/surface adhesin